MLAGPVQAAAVDVPPQTETVDRPSHSSSEDRRWPCACPSSVYVPQLLRHVHIQVDGMDVAVDYQAGKVECTDPGLQVRSCHCRCAACHCRCAPCCACPLPILVAVCDASTLGHSLPPCLPKEWLSTSLVRPLQARIDKAVSRLTTAMRPVNVDQQL